MGAARRGIDKEMPRRAAQCPKCRCFVDIGSNRDTAQTPALLIDGDHDRHAVRSDHESCRNSGKILVFHDICPGVGQLWDEAQNFEFHEITD